MFIKVEFIEKLIQVTIATAVNLISVLFFYIILIIFVQFNITLIMSFLIL